MRSDSLQPLLTAHGPFVSVFFDDSRDTPDALARLDAMWRGLRADLENEDIHHKVIDNVEQVVLHGLPAVGRQGRAVVSSADDVLIDEHVSQPPVETVLRVSDYPYLLPLLDNNLRRPVYVIAAVDHEGANITLHLADDVCSEKVDGGGFPVHKPVTAGWSGYGDMQRTTEEAVRMNVRAVAHRLTELVDDSGPEVVFVSGEVRSRTDVVSALPRRVVARVVQLPAGGHGRRVEEGEVAESVAAEFERRRHAEIAALAQRFRAEANRGSGLAVEGLDAVCAALREGDVDTLIIGNLGDATVLAGERRTVVATVAEALSEFGESPRRVVRADEALPFAALSVGASVTKADEDFAAADGVAALLRYAAADDVSR